MIPAALSAQHLSGNESLFLNADDTAMMYRTYKLNDTVPATIIKYHEKPGSILHQVQGYVVHNYIATHTFKEPTYLDKRKRPFSKVWVIYDWRPNPIDYRTKKPRK